MTSVPARRRSSALVPLDETTIALIYSRVSSDEQDDEGVSLPAQVGEARRYTSRQAGWIAGDEFQDVESGRKDDRADYQRLLLTVRGLALGGHRVAVTVASLDRLGRNVAERVRAYEELKALGVMIHSAREGGIVSEFTYNILAAVAQEETRKLSERIRASWRYFDERGWHKPGSVAWGYTARPATSDERANGAPKSVLDVDELAAPYVRETWARFANGESMRSLAIWAAGLPATVRGDRNLGYNAIRKLLRAPVYVGRLGGYDDERPEAVLERPVGRWPALVDDETFRRATRAHERARRVPKQASGAYALTGLLRCSRCGSRMSGRLKGSQGGTRAPRREYICHAGLVLGAANDEQRCLMTVAAELIESRVVTTVKAMLVAAARPGVKAKIAAAWDRQLAAERATGPEQTIARLEQARTKTRERLARASVAFLDGGLAKPEYDLVRDALRAELERLEAELEILGQRRRTTTAPPRLDWLLDGVRGWAEAIAAADPEPLRRALGDLLERVEPVRLGRGAYEVQLEWTAVGRWLCRAAAELDPSDNMVSVDHSGRTRLSTPTIRDHAEHAVGIAHSA